MTPAEDRGLDRLAELVREVRRHEGDDALVEELVKNHGVSRCRTEPPPVQEISVAGRRVGAFQLAREIGRGGMGVVYEAFDPALQRSVALKVLPNHLTLLPSRVERFQREATAVARLRHENIVTIHGVESDGDCHYFAMELVEGASLDTVLANLRGMERSARGFFAALGCGEGAGSQRYIDLVADLVARVADALEHAHDNGVVHRDVKPSNILVRRCGTPVLTDFGLAILDDAATLTHAGELAGTPSYMSPEQAAGCRRAVDARSDVFSLGVTLYELLTLEKPFRGATTQEVMLRIMHFDAKSPRALCTDVPEDLAAIVQKALEKRPEKRYASAKAFADDLRAFLAHAPVQARRVTRTGRLLRYLRREPLKAAFAAVLALGVPSLAALGGFLLAKRAAIQVGEQELVVQRRETLLARALLVQNAELRSSLPIMRLSDPDTVSRELERELRDSPGDVEMLAARGWIVFRTKGAAAALAWLDGLGARGDARELRRLRVALLRTHKIRSESEQAEAARLEEELGAPRSPFESFVHFLGVITRTPVTAQRLEEAMGVLLRSALDAARPRKVFFYYVAMFGIASGQLERARQFAEACPRQWPDDSFSWLIAGWMHWACKDGGAKPYLAKALELDPNNLSALVQLGSDAFDAGEVEEALPWLRRALELDPACSDARSRICKHALKGRDREGLRKNLEEWEAHAGDDKQSWRDLAEFRMRQPLPASLRDDAAVERALAAAMRISAGTDIGILWSFAVWKEQHGEYRAALDALERANRLPNIYSAKPEQLRAREEILRSLRAKVAAGSAAFEAAQPR